MMIIIIIISILLFIQRAQLGIHTWYLAPLIPSEETYEVRSGGLRVTGPRSAD